MIDEHVLKTFLLESPGINSANEVILQRGYASAASAYNAAIQKASSELLVFVHQDVYLPEGWIETVTRATDILSVQDSNWGVMGVWGAVDSRQRVTSIGREIMDGSDRFRVSKFCIHNTNIGGVLPLEFWKCYLFMRKKWKDDLPIDTPCTRISFSCWPIVRWNIMYARNVAVGRQRKLQRAESPADLYREGCSWTDPIYLSCLNWPLKMSHEPVFRSLTGSV